MNASYKKTPESKAKQKAYTESIKHTEEYKEKRRWYTSKQREKDSYKDWLVQNSRQPKQRKKAVSIHNKRMKSDIQYKLRHYMRARLKHAIKNNQKAGSAISDLGCTMEYFTHHIERQFKKGMSWNNMGNGWHIDHIRPLKSFDLTDRVQFLDACNYKNLRPMWKKDNLKKGDKDPIEYARTIGLLL